MQARPVASVDPYSGTTHFINPSQIAAAVLATREALAAKLARGLVPRVADANMAVLRSHLEAHTYVSGSNNDRRPSYRQYRGGQQQRRQQGQQLRRQQQGQ